MIAVGVYTFEAKIASRGHHVYKETSWSKAPGEEEVNIEIKTSQSSKNIDHTLVLFVLRRNISKGVKNSRTLQERYIEMDITSSKQKVVL